MTQDNPVLERSYFERPVLEVARGLLNCRLCRRTESGIIRWQIRETEAYDGPQDTACHAHKGRTRRTEVMFGEAGVWYVYFCYGIHWLLNVVTGPPGYPAAVLIRGAGELTGPARLTRILGIDGSMNGKSCSVASGLWIEEGSSMPEDLVERTPRIGVDYAGPDWSQRPYRFLVRKKK